MTLQPAFSPWLIGAAAVLIVGVLVLLGRRRRYVLSAAALLLLVATLRPVIGGSEPAVVRVAGAEAPNVFLIVDRSADMAVADIDGRPRMEAALDDIGALIERHPEARFAVISFDSRPSLDWPLSADSWSLQPVLAAARPSPRGREDMTNAGAASNVLRYQLISAVQQFPKARNLVYYLGAGAPGSTVPQREFQIPGNSVDGGAVLGYDGTGAPGLQAVADQIGVPYVARSGAQPMVEDAPDDQSTDQPSDVAPAAGFEVYAVLAGVAAVLILLELYQALHHLRRTRLDRIAVGR